MFIIKLYKTIFLSAFLFVTIHLSISAQESKLYIRQINSIEDTIYQSPQQKAEFPDGEAGLFKFISKNFMYPKIAYMNGIHGVVYVSFVVERDGSISNLKIIKGIGAGCNEEAIRVIRLMPLWEPAKHNGKAVASLYSLPVRFEFD